MVLGYSAIIYGTQALLIKSIAKSKQPATIKQKVGGSLIQNVAPGRDSKDIVLNMNGVIFDTSTVGTTSRRVLESYDDRLKHHYSDGFITGSYIITDLTFNDTDDNPMHFEYSLSLVQYNQ